MENTASRPARKQVETPVTGYEKSNDMAVYNIWDGRRQRAHRPPREGRGTKIRSEYKCHPALDSGWTRGEKSGCSYCCLYFARGICHHGADCNFLHRVPTADDEARHAKEPQYDIFGRDRLDEEGRTKGAGGINRDCTTLYIYLGGAASQPVDSLKTALVESFSEWGSIDDVSVISNKGIAFVRYVWRSSAEFAKAAMHQQTLKGIKVDHVLDVRWANDDPNPRARARVKRSQEEAMAQAYLDSIAKLDPEAKKARLHELNLTAAYRPDGVASAYPDTSAQYGGVEGGEEQGGYYDDAVIREYEQKISGGNAGGVGAVLEEEEDDINRYLPLSDEDEEALEYPEEFTKPEENEEAVKEQGTAVAAEEQKREGSPVADALGLIGGYGSDSDDENGKS